MPPTGDTSSDGRPEAARFILKRWAGIAAGGLLLALHTGCAGLPEAPNRTPSYAMKSTETTTLAGSVRHLVAAHPGHSGLHPLSKGVNAFAARFALADAAERTLDLQYYIWRGDNTGRLLTARILRAADRGVRVRLLLDDIGTSPRDRRLLALSSHPNIQVRLFNPIARRSLRWLSAVMDFTRVNRRMHNKAFIADGQVAIVGGRNIGDEYFAAHQDLDFADLDVLAIGPVVNEVSESFDLFWNSRASLPIDTLTRLKLPPDEIAGHRQSLNAHVEAMHDSAYLKELRESPLARQIQQSDLPFHWGRAWTVYDLPEKFAAHETDTSTHLLPQLRGITDATEREFFIVSPYFVPGSQGLKLFLKMRKRGVRVVVVTNSLASTDVLAVHAVYERYRKPLLRAGVEIYESRSLLKPDATTKIRVLRGSRRASLHAKTFAFDRRVIFIGSMNLDPRSTLLNTEIGIVFACPSLAQQLPEKLEAEFHRTVYQLALDGRRITWIEHDGDTTIRHTTEPCSTGWQRFLVRFLSWLPLENQL